jgi:hypothetical protein
MLKNKFDIFARSNTGIMRSNPTLGKDAFVYSVFVFSCAASGLATSLSPVEGVVPTVYNIRSLRLIIMGNRPERLIRQSSRRVREE